MISARESRNGLPFSKVISQANSSAAAATIARRAVSGRAGLHRAAIEAGRPGFPRSTHRLEAGSQASPTYEVQGIGSPILAEGMWRKSDSFAKDSADEQVINYLAKKRYNIALHGFLLNIAGYLQ